jgi:outer membrane receptor protein involved in Fe transport
MAAPDNTSARTQLKLLIQGCVADNRPSSLDAKCLQARRKKEGEVMSVGRAGILVPLLLLPCAAVSAAEESGDTAGAGLAEVVVTAQKREENLRYVPQSISVVSADQLAAQHIEAYADLASTVPGLSYSSLGGPGLSNLEIRGISSTIGESTVSIYLDDAPITIRNNSFYAGQPEPQLFDLARAEVLRGPQGTLYGASAMGGTIKLVSNSVDLQKFSGQVFQDLSGTKNGGLNYISRGVLNIPIVDGVLGLRLGVQTSRDSGYVDHLDLNGIVDKTHINSHRTDAGKFLLTYVPTADLTVTLSEFAQRTIMDDTGLVNLQTPDYFINKLVLEPGRDTFSVTSLKVAYDLHWADLTSISSYAYRNFPRTTDGTYFNSVYVGYFVDNLLGLPGLDGNFDGYKLAALPGPVYNTLTTKQPTEELRLSSKAYNPESGPPVSWIVGLYYSDAKYVGTSAQYIPGFNQTFLSVYGVPPEEPLGAATPNDLFYQFVNNLDDREYAAFGEFSYYPTPQLRLTAGMRELHGRDAATNISSGFFASTPYSSGQLTANAFTPKFSVSYDFTDSMTAYGTVGKGFRLGGINSPVPAEQCAVDLTAFGLSQAPGGYKSDTVWNYELGTKGLYFARTTSINASIYDIEWDHIQLDVPLQTCGFDFFDNLGHARSYGGELEILQKIGREFTARAAGEYNHARFTENVEGLGIASGDVVPGSPEWSVNFSASYEHPMSDAVSGFAHADWRYIGSSHGTFVRSSPDYLRPSYTLLGASVGITAGAWELSIYAKNILDDRKIIQSPADNYVAEGYTPVPRILGVTGNVRF